MREELVRRNYAETTIRSYLQAIEDFRRFIQKRLDQVSSEEIRKYQVHLLEERKLEPGTVAYRVAALRFFYVRTLKRSAMKEDLPYPHSPKHAHRLPTILTLEEVSRLIDAARNLFHYAMLLTMYSAGLRRQAGGLLWSARPPRSLDDTRNEILAASYVDLDKSWDGIVGTLDALSAVYP